MWSWTPWSTPRTALTPPQGGPLSSRYLRPYHHPCPQLDASPGQVFTLLTASLLPLVVIHVTVPSKVSTSGSPDSSAGKEPACKAGGPGSIPGLGRSPGEEIGYPLQCSLGFPGGSDGKESTCIAQDPGLIPGWEDPLEKSMATYSSILAWRIPWTEEPGGLQSMGSQRVRPSKVSTSGSVTTFSML